MNASASRNLKGLKLNGGWEVIEIVHKPPGATGGKFSVGYLVKDENGKEAYLKALDYSAALQSSDIPRALQDMVEAFNFERDLLAKCKSHGLHRIVTALADGVVQVPGYGLLSNVNYLIFEKADGDIRHQHAKMHGIDVAWCLRSLHHAATGIRQLHSRGIAHQDLKPSNVLVFNKVESKITDLGRAADRNIPSRIDTFKTPGDTGYAPLEQFYDYRVTNDFQRRYSADMYLFGSLIFFYFLNTSATQAITALIPTISHMNYSGNDFKSDLPIIRSAFFSALEELKREIDNFAPGSCGELVEMAKQLCEPDPHLRGHPKNRAAAYDQQFSLERFVSRLNVLASRAEYGLL